jgi:hypothetical protein
MPGERERPIRVRDPRLSEEANELLSAELRRALGRDTAPISEADLDRPPAPDEPAALERALVSMRFLLAVVLPGALIVGAGLSLLLDTWWIVAAVAAAYVLATGIVVGLGLTTAAQRMAEPSPELLARLRREGIADPEREFRQRVRRIAAAVDAEPEAGLEPATYRLQGGRSTS